LKRLSRKLNQKSEDQPGSPREEAARFQLRHEGDESVTQDCGTSRTEKQLWGLVEDAAIQGELGQKAAAKIELERVWKKYEAIRPVKLDKGQPKEIIKGKFFVTEKRDASHNFTREGTTRDKGRHACARKMALQSLQYASTLEINPFRDLADRHEHICLVYYQCIDTVSKMQQLLQGGSCWT
jgi:hypothetical protein